VNSSISSMSSCSLRFNLAVSLENFRHWKSNHSCVCSCRLAPSYNFLSSQMASHAALMRLIISDASRI